MKVSVQPMCRSCTKSCKVSCFKKRFGFSDNPEFRKLFEKMAEISGSSLVIEVGLDE